MSVKSELDNIVSNLRETRKAILGRGGEISTTAGLKDLPSAIYNIPADASLSFYEDSSLAYEKIVPSNAEEYAALVKVGGLSIPNNNLCISDGVYELNGLMSFSINLGELEEGEYHLHFEGTISGAVLANTKGNSDVFPRDLYSYNVTGTLADIDYTLTVFEKEMCEFTLVSAKADTPPDDAGYETASLINGTITGIMLCKASDTDQSYKPYQKTSNLCRADGYYELSNEPTAEAQNFSKSLGELEEGVYQLAWYGDAQNVLSLDASGPYVACPQDDLIGNNRVFGVTKACVASFSMCSPCSFDNMYDRPDEFTEEEIKAACWGGEITGLMLVKLSDTCSSIEDVKNTEPIADLEYEPYVGSLLQVKPTNLESRGAQLFDESAITRASNNNLVPTNAYGVVENGYLKAKYSSYASSVYWLPFSIKLTKGTYTISADMYVGNVCPSLNIVIGLGAERKSPITARTNLYAYDTWERKSVTITLAEDNIYYFVASGMGDSTNYTKLDVRFKDIQIQRGETATEFHPFSAEPIDTLEIPEAVQSLDGWGLGIDAEYNNHIVWRDGRIIYIQMLDEFDLANVGEWKRHGAYSYFYTFPALSPAMKDLDFKLFSRSEVPIGLSSKYEMVSINTSITSGNDKVICYGTTDTKYINVRDSAYTDVETFKEAMKGVKLVYALETPIETDITHLFTDTSPFLKVQGGGSIILHNRYNRAVPSTIKYTVKVGI